MASICTACVLESRGIRTKDPVKHICYKGNADYKEPEFKMNLGVKRYRINIHKTIFTTSKASKYHICRNQIVNGYKTGPACEIWIPHQLHFYDDNVPTSPCIWVDESHYKNLAFV